MFEDLMYPDNKIRAIRVSQLAADCADIILQLADDKEEIGAMLENANQAIVKAYQNRSFEPIQLKDYNRHTSNFLLSVAVMECKPEAQKW